jgi:hypothetical protein
MTGSSADSAAPMRPPIGRFRRMAFLALAAILSLVIGFTFVVVTTLTIGIWLTDPGYAETNPVVDLGFFALGALVIGSGVGVQLRAPERNIAGLQQAIIGSLALTVAGLLGDRVEPFAGGLVILIAAVVLAALHPMRGEFFKRGPGVNPRLAALTILVAAPAAGYAANMLDLSRQAGPSCFVGQCARGDRFAEMAALAGAIVLIAWLTLWRTRGWRVPARSVAAAAIVVGLASIALPDVPGAVGTVWGAVTVTWGIAFVAAAERGP